MRRRPVPRRTPRPLGQSRRGRPARGRARGRRTRRGRPARSRSRPRLPARAGCAPRANGRGPAPFAMPRPPIASSAMNATTGAAPLRKSRREGSAGSAKRGGPPEGNWRSLGKVATILSAVNPRGSNRLFSREERYSDRSAAVSTSRPMPRSSTSRSTRSSGCFLMTSWRLPCGSAEPISSRSAIGSATGCPRLPR